MLKQLSDYWKTKVPSLMMSFNFKVSAWRPKSAITCSMALALEDCHCGHNWSRVIPIVNAQSVCGRRKWMAHRIGIFCCIFLWKRKGSWQFLTPDWPLIPQTYLYFGVGNSMGLAGPHGIVQNAVRVPSCYWQPRPADRTSGGCHKRRWSLDLKTITRITKILSCVHQLWDH